MEPRPRILITGASGFIGQRLLKYLSFDNSVLGFGGSDLISSSRDFGLDICILKSARREISEFRPTHIIHCAGLAHKAASKKAAELEKLVSSNVALTLHLAALAKEIGTKRFVFLSTIGVHGSSSLHFPRYLCISIYYIFIYSFYIYLFDLLNK